MMAGWFSGPRGWCNRSTASRYHHGSGEPWIESGHYVIEWKGHAITVHCGNFIDGTISVLFMCSRSDRALSMRREVVESMLIGKVIPDPETEARISRLLIELGERCAAASDTRSASGGGYRDSNRGHDGALVPRSMIMETLPRLSGRGFLFDPAAIQQGGAELRGWGFRWASRRFARNEQNGVIRFSACLASNVVPAWRREMATILIIILIILLLGGGGGYYGYNRYGHTGLGGVLGLLLIVLLVLWVAGFFGGAHVNHP